MKTIKQQLKRAFTIVELVIVIAVIAALAAVLIPTFVNVLNSASESNDTVLAKNLDTSLITVQNKLTKTDVTDGDGNYIYNVTEAITLVRNDGYDVSKLTPTADNADYVYNASTNRFLYYTDNFTALTYGEEPASTDTLVVIDNDLDRVDEATSTSSLLNGLTVQYCVYSTDVVTISTDKTLTIWVYTESGTSTITATNSVVYRYGEGTQDSAAVDDNSYYLYGKIDTIVLSQGHLNVKNENSVKDVILYVSTSDNQPYVTGSAVENIVIDTTTTGVTYSSENKDKTTVTATNTIEKDSSLASVEGYGTATNPFVVDSAETLSTILNGTYTNVTIEVSDSEGSSTTVTASKNDDNEIILSGELSETYYAAVSDSVTLGDEYRVLVTSSGSSSVTFIEANENSVVRIGTTYYSDLSLIASKTIVNDNGTVTLYFGSTGTETNITLLKDIELSNSNIQIAENATVSIDLNNCTLTMSASGTNKIYVNSGATLTIDDTSETKNGKITTSVSAMVVNFSAGSVGNLNNGTIENTCSSLSYCVVQCYAATFNMTGGTIIADKAGTNGVLKIYSNTSTVATTNISGGTIENKSGANSTIYLANGSVGQTLNISGDTLVVGSPDLDNTKYGVIYLSGKSTTGLATLDMSGGEIKCEASTYYAIYCSQYSSLSISKGTLNKIYLKDTTTTAIIKTGLVEDENVVSAISLNPTTTNGYTSYSVKYTAENGYAKIVDSDGNVKGYYGNLYTAMTVAADNDKIVLLKDCGYGSTVKDKSITIDLNGFSISSAGTCLTAGSGGKISLTNSSETKSTITNTSSNYALTVAAGGEITLGANIEATSSGTYTVFVGEYGENSSEVATLNVYGTISNTNTSGIAITGYGVDIIGGTVINIYDGAKVTSNGWAIYHPQAGTLTVTGGEISGATGIEMRAGTLNVIGGTITSTLAEGEKFSFEANGSGTTVYGAAIAISQHSTQLAITVTISGGTISGYYALYETDTVSTSTLSENVTITISGTATLTSTATGVTNGYYTANDKVTDNRVSD